MDVHIGEIHSNVTTSDDQALLDPRTMHQIVQAVLAELREQEAYEERRQADRTLAIGPATSPGEAER